ncbi:hypothetical protein LINPERPRIM_LOCUS1739 [Linum perenne]
MRGGFPLTLMALSIPAITGRRGWVVCWLPLLLTWAPALLCERSCRVLLKGCVWLGIRVLGS